MHQYSPLDHLRLHFAAQPNFEPITMMTIGSMALTAAGGAVNAMGTIAGGDAAAQAGRARAQALDFEAKQQDMAAQESRASAQRQGFERQRQTGLLQSQLQARAAASGGGADDPTVLDLAGGIGGRGVDAFLTDIYRGENRARGLEDQAMGSRMSGQAAIAEGAGRQRAAQLSAMGTILGSAGSMFGTYAKMKPRPSPTPTRGAGGVGLPPPYGLTGLY